MRISIFQDSHMGAVGLGYINGGYSCQMVDCCTRQGKMDGISINRAFKKKSVGLSYTCIFPSRLVHLWYMILRIVKMYVQVLVPAY